MALPDDLYDAGARQRAFNQAIVDCEADAHTIAFKADNAANGIMPVTVVFETMKTVQTLSDAMLEFDTKVAEALLKEFRVRGEEPSDNPFCERHEQGLAEFLSKWAKGLPSGIIGCCRVAKFSESHLSDLVRDVHSRVQSRIRDEYGRRRHDFDLEVESIRRGGKPPRRKKRRGPKQIFDPKEDAKIAMHWNAARREGTYKADFAKSRDLTTKKLDALLARERTRKRRAN